MIFFFIVGIVGRYVSFVFLYLWWFIRDSVVLIILFVLVRLLRFILLDFINVWNIIN